MPSDRLYPGEVVGVLLVVALVLTLTFLLGTQFGSAEEPADERNGAVEPVVVYTEDGREVTCVIYTTVNRGGVDCDWGGV